MKRILLITLILFTSFGFTNPLVITRGENIHRPPRNYLICSHFPSSKLINLNASVSGQFSEGELKYMLTTLPSAPIYLIDLREESHGFLKGHPISWRNEKNWINQGKTFEEILADENRRLERIQGETEEMVALRHGLGYYRIAARDHTKPSDLEVDRFLAFLATKEEGAWLHFHCSAGKGRARLFLALYDIFLNARHDSLDEILERQKLMGGKDFTRPLVAKKGSKAWKTPHHEERVQFLHNFYQYCKEDTSLSWSEWAAKSVNGT